jgi:hypothetical protein
MSRLSERERASRLEDREERERRLLTSNVGGVVIDGGASESVLLLVVVEAYSRDRDGVIMLAYNEQNVVVAFMVSVGNAAGCGGERWEE